MQFNALSVSIDFSGCCRNQNSILKQEKNKNQTTEHWLISIVLWSMDTFTNWCNYKSWQNNIDILSNEMCQ